MKSLRIIVLLVIPAGFVSSTQASWLSEITGVDVNVPAGTIEFQRPKPESIPAMLQNLPKDVGQALLNPAGANVATLIRHAREQAAHSAQPLPPSIVAEMRDFFPPEVLGRARFTTRGGRVAIDSAILGLRCAGAITLDDIIVFEVVPGTTIDELEFWAHELTHVSQYRNMGVEGFANIYSVAWEELERPAREYASTVKSHLRRRANGASAQPAFVTNAGAFSSSNYLSSDQFRSAARSYFPASTCATWVTVIGGAQVSNVCPVPIAITGWAQQDPWTGAPFQVPCQFNCLIAPGATKPFTSPYPGYWIDVYFAY